MNSAVETKSQRVGSESKRERIWPIALTARTWQLAWPFMKFGILFLWALIRRDRDPQPDGSYGYGSVAPKILTEYFKRCGGGFVKVGQFLATRYDVLPKRYCDELMTLLDDASEVPYEQIEPIIRADLKNNDRIDFDSISKHPIASASIAQVHSATLKTGEKVVLKVMRPGIRSVFNVDLFYLKWFSRGVDKLGLLPRGQLASIGKEVKEFTQEELDFRREARTAALMHKLLANDGVHHYAPRIYPDLCGNAVITMERIEGISVKELLAKKEDEDALKTWYENGITPQGVAHSILFSMLMQTIHHRVFQMDAHAANVFVMKGGKIAWVDFGMVGWLDERLVEQQLKLRKAIADERIHEAYNCFLDTLDPRLQELGEFEIKVKSIIRDWLIAIKDEEAPVFEKSSGSMLVRLLIETRRAKIPVPSQFVRLYRAIITADSLMLELDPRIDSLGILRDFVETESRRQLAGLSKENLSRSTIDALAQAILRVPRVTTKVMERLENLDELFRRPRNEFAWIRNAFLTVLGFLKFLAILILLLSVLYSVLRLQITVELPVLRELLAYGWRLVLAAAGLWFFFWRLSRRIEKS